MWGLAMESLAHFLGVPEYGAPADAEPARPFDQSITIRDFCRGVLRSRDYRLSILQRIRLGSLPPAVEIAMYHYAEGKPVERVEVEDKTPHALQDMSIEQLEERALRLLDMARGLRSRSEDSRTPSVH